MKNKSVVCCITVIGLVILMCGMVFAFPSDITVNASKATALQEPSNVILSYIQYLGYAIAVGMLLYIGIKYMMSAANERAELKKGAVNWVIGAILVAGVTAIVGAVIGIGNQMNGRVNISPGSKYSELSDEQKQYLQQEYQTYRKENEKGISYNNYLLNEYGVEP